MELNRKKITVLFSLTLLLALVLGAFQMNAAQAQAAYTITVNRNTTYQSIWGFGGAATWDVNDLLTSFTAARRTEILDKLFGMTGNNAGISIVRLEIQPYQRTEVAPVEWNVKPAPDVLATFMPSNGVYDWNTDTAQRWFAGEANLRASDIHYLGVPWSPPGWMKTNGTPTGGGHLRTDMYDTFATYMKEYVNHYRNVFGIDIRWISMQNEPTLALSYATAEYTTAEFSTVVSKVADAVHSLNQGVYVGGPEQPTRSMNASYLDGMTAAARAKMDFIVTHDYGGASTALQRFGKPILNTEVWSERFDGYEDYSVNDALRWAGEIDGALQRGEPGWMYWWLLEPMQKNTAEGLISMQADGTYFVHRRLYAVGQYSRFMRLGDLRIQTSTTNANLKVSAAKDASGRAAIVVINSSNAAISSNVAGLTKSALQVYRTSATENLAQQANVMVNGGTAIVSFPAQSITTLVEFDNGPTNTPGPTATVTKTPTALPAGTVSIEAGGAANFTDSLGNVWLADTGFTAGAGGVADRGAIAINNTVDDRIYQTERWGMTAFTYPVANGTYQVNLHFAETYAGITGAGQRVFSANVEGTNIANIDVFAEAGGLNTALIKSATVNVTDGQLNITFAATANNPLINGIQIIPAGPTLTSTTTRTPTVTSTPTVTATRTSTGTITSTPTITNTPNASAIRIEAGGAANFTDSLGNLWLADTGFTVGAGGVADRGNTAIANTVEDRVYQTERWGMTAFAYNVPNGTYQVNLHFAETYAGITAAGQRVFSANVEGTNIANIDVFAQAGGLNSALIKSATVTVADGQLNIAFTASANNPEINGIEIIPSGPAPTATVTPTATKTATRTNTPIAPVIRIEAGGAANFVDASGNTWLADAGFTAGAGGVVDRGAIAIGNTVNDRIYQTERWGMTAFTYPVTNGAYQVNLHFAETYAGITAAGQRVFSATVEGTAISNIDVFAQAGGLNNALVKSACVNVADGQLSITFAATVNNPEINGVEIVPVASCP